MRFHFGVSFRLSSLKKFIFPILFGVLAYFLSSYINLGQVYALTNTSTDYNLHLEEVDFSQYHIFTDINTQQLLDNIISNYNYSTHDLLVQTFPKNSSIEVYVYLIPHQANLQLSVFGLDNNLKIARDTTINNMYFWYFNPNQTSISTSNDVYNLMMSCLNDLSTCNFNSLTIGTTGSSIVNSFYQINVYSYSSNFLNNQSYNIYSDYFGWNYYSSISVVYNSNMYSNDNTRFVKNLIINGTTISNQDDLPTYYDLFPVIPDEPQPEPEPDVSNVPFSSKVYWFGEHDTTDEILENIYILLFLSFSGIFFLKVITIIKNTRW